MLVFCEWMMNCELLEMSYRSAPRLMDGIGHGIFLQAEDGAHSGSRSDFVNELHPGGAGIGKTGVETGVGQGFEQGLGSIHGVSVVGLLV
jgi:hypothetical protein